MLRIVIRLHRTNVLKISNVIGYFDHIFPASLNHGDPTIRIGVTRRECYVVKNTLTVSTTPHATLALPHRTTLIDGCGTPQWSAMVGHGYCGTDDLFVECRLGMELLATPG